MLTVQKLLRSYRNEIKGFAILWVVFFHAQLGLEGWVYQVQRIGYGGVDIFFFMSGFGLYHSLKKDNDLGGYLKRRAQRILPAYLPFCLVWLAVMVPLAGEGWTASARIALGNLTMLGFFANVPLMINWYVSALAVSLLLAPAFYALLKTDKGFWSRLAAILLLAFALGLAFAGERTYMAASRLPVFVLGMAAACTQMEGVQGQKTGWILGAAGIAGWIGLNVCMDHLPGTLLTYGMYWHPFVLIVPGLCAGLAWVFCKIPTKFLAPVRFLGAASFEIFLFNVWVELLGKRYGLCNSAMDWVVWSMVSIAAGCAYHWLIGRLCRAKVKK